MQGFRDDKLVIGPCARPDALKVMGRYVPLVAILDFPW